MGKDTAKKGLVDPSQRPILEQKKEKWEKRGGML